MIIPLIAESATLLEELKMIGTLFRNREKHWRSLNSPMQDYMCQVDNVVRTLDKCLHSWSAVDIEKTQQFAKRIFQGEKAVQESRQEFIQCVFRSNCSTQSQQDLLCLSRGLDLIVSYSKAVSKDIVLLAKREVRKDIAHSACEIAKLLLEEMSIAKTIIDTLGMGWSLKDLETVSHLASEINHLDHKIHELYYQNKGDWLLLPEEYPVATLIIVNNMIRNLVHITNSANRAVEHATVMISSSLD